jgi:hypothetical protein
MPLRRLSLRAGIKRHPREEGWLENEETPLIAAFLCFRWIRILEAGVEGVAEVFFSLEADKLLRDLAAFK